MEITFTYEGEEIVVRHVPLRVAHEAEKALQVGFTDSQSSQMMVLLYAGLREKNPDKPAFMLADEVMGFDLFSLGTVEDDRPLESEGNGAAPDLPPATGLPPSEASVSPSP